MDCFRALIYQINLRYRPPPILEPSPPPDPSLALESSAFRKLPPELVLHVTTFLGPDSAASFSLSCRSFYHTLGRRHLDILKANTRLYRRSFLAGLERDLPNHILCHYCNTLHSIEKVHLYKTYAAGQMLALRGIFHNNCWKVEQDDGWCQKPYTFPVLFFRQSSSK